VQHCGNHYFWLYLDLKCWYFHIPGKSWFAGSSRGLCFASYLGDFDSSWDPQFLGCFRPYFEAEI
jgi:hypothetical protein